MKILFIATTCIPVHAKTLEERPLGGTETGLIRLAAALAEKGHDVTVLTSHESPVSDAVKYIRGSAFDARNEFDALISIQSWQNLLAPFISKKRYFWTGDGADQFANYGFGDARVATKVDGLLTVSDWQADTLCAGSGFPRNKAFYIGNGVHLPHFMGSEIRSPTRMMFASAPYRGLDIAAQAFTVLQRLVPNLEFHVFAGFDLYNTNQPYFAPLLQQFKNLEAKLKTIPGIILHGNKRQHDLAREYMKSSILFYPNRTFETCCMVALEAQAAGCTVVTSRNSALPQTVGDAGILVDGTPGSAPYMTDLVDKTVRLLRQPNEIKRLGELGTKRIAVEYTWQAVAERFEKIAAR